MSRWIWKGIAFAAGLVLALLAVLVIGSMIGSNRFAGQNQEEKEYLLHCARAVAFQSGPPRPVAGLPAPLRKYLTATESAGKPIPKLAIMSQRGALRVSPDNPWIPFESEQIFAFWRPGFIWTAKARMAPLVSLFARDKFIEGKGFMLINLAGLIKMADARGPEFDLSAAVRFWTEAICLPEVARSPHLRWEEMNERQARMRVNQWGVKIDAVVDFDEKGLPAAVHSDRYRDAGGEMVFTPWSGYMRDWKIIDGRLFPASWESVWRLPEGDFSAVRIEVVGIHTE